MSSRSTKINTVAVSGALTDIRSIAVIQIAITVIAVTISAVAVDYHLH